MTARTARPRFFPSLRLRVLVLVALCFALLSVPAFYAFAYIVDRTSMDIGAMLAERQVQYDRYRGIAALDREVALAEALSRAPAIIEWAAEEHDPDRKADGLAVLEHYRQAFDDQSVFFVIDESGSYYFNDAQQSYAADPYRYSVRADNPRDGWYFTTRERRQGCFLNVDNDDVLRVTKVWINCIVDHEGRVLGIVGTGLDLSDFIRGVVDIDQPGLESVFVDQSGAIQAHPDASLIDFHSLTKAAGERSTIFEMLDDPRDAAQLRALMNTARMGEGEVQLLPVTVEGRPALLGVGYLARIGWYNVALMNVDAIVDRSLFVPVGLLVAGLAVVLTLVLAVMFKLVVLDRLDRLADGLNGLRAGRRAKLVPDSSADEIGQVSRALSEMADAITESEVDLERQIHERTRQLEALAHRDALTGVYNRRGLDRGYGKLGARAARAGGTNGILLIDVDGFKAVNDTHGHSVGDAVITEVANRLSSAIRKGDICGRWGGDEFIIIVRDCDPDGLGQVARALSEMMARVPVTAHEGLDIAITVSIGAAVLSAQDSLQTATDLADVALYSAKEEGRNRVVLLEPGADDGPAQALA